MHPERTSPPSAFMPPRDSTCHEDRLIRQGSILLLVLVVVAVLALSTSSQLLMMQNESRATRHAGRQQQALRLAESGIAYLQTLLALERLEVARMGGLLDNRELLQGVLVDDDTLPEYRGRFTVLSPAMMQGRVMGFRYGLEDESAKLNLNTLLQDKKDQPGNSADGSAGEDDSSEDDSADGSSNRGASVPTTNSPRDRLMVLPGMEREIADAILDYLDADDMPRLFGAESDYYQGLDPPTLPVNGPITRLDQLLSVRGVTPALLYGLDANRNYEVDWHENSRDRLDELDNSSGQLDQGWSAYLTTASAERLVNPEGELKIDINSDDLQQLQQKIGEVITPDQATFIIALRQYGPMAEQPETSSPGSSPGGNPGGSSSGSPKNNSAGGLSGNAAGTAPGGNAGQPAQASDITIDFEKKGQYQLTSLLDLVGVKVQIVNSENAPPQILESPWPDNPSTFQGDWLQLADHVSIGTAERLSGRVNINQASHLVLGTLDGLSESDIDQILSRRDEQLDPATSPQRHACWLLAEGIVTLDEMKQLNGRITTQGAIYRGQVVGYFESGTPVARLEVVIDQSNDQQAIISWTDLSTRGPGFQIDTLGAEDPL